MNLLFVYNANSGALNSILDIGHKLLSPSTYQCHLCALTHHALYEKREWSRFKHETTHRVVFLHKDEFESQYPAQKAEYPVVFYESEGVHILLSKTDLEQIHTIQELISAICQRSDSTTR
jgi:hypothetical protein